MVASTSASMLKPPASSARARSSARVDRTWSFIVRTSINGKSRSRDSTTRRTSGNTVLGSISVFISTTMRPGPSSFCIYRDDRRSSVYLISEERRFSTRSLHLHLGHLELSKQCVTHISGKPVMPPQRRVFQKLVERIDYLSAHRR